MICGCVALVVGRLRVAPCNPALPWGMNDVVTKTSDDRSRGGGEGGRGVEQRGLGQGVWRLCSFAEICSVQSQNTVFCFVFVFVLCVFL